MWYESYTKKAKFAENDKGLMTNDSHMMNHMIHGHVYL